MPANECKLLSKALVAQARDAAFAALALPRDTLQQVAAMEAALRAAADGLARAQKYVW